MVEKKERAGTSGAPADRVTYERRLLAEVFEDYNRFVGEIAAAFVEACPEKAPTIIRRQARIFRQAVDVRTGDHFIREAAKHAAEFQEHASVVKAIGQLAAARRKRHEE